jgi:molecular chaperone Hsp33
MVLEKKPLKAQCTCSEARMRRALTLVGVKELQAMIDEVGEAVVKCDFCETEYRADADELRKMIEEAKA